MTDEEFEARLLLNTLYDYAAQNWGYHARTASTEAEELITELLKGDAKVSAITQVLLSSGTYSGYSQRVLLIISYESFTGVGLIEMTIETHNALMMRLLPESEK
jgi:hypothetical protein